MSLLSNLSEHVKSQLGRFARLFVAAFLTTGVLTSGSYSKDAVIAAVVGALEVAWRELSPVTPVDVPPPAK